MCTLYLNMYLWIIQACLNIAAGGSAICPSLFVCVELFSANTQISKDTVNWASVFLFQTVLVKETVRYNTTIQSEGNEQNGERKRQVSHVYLSRAWIWSRLLSVSNIFSNQFPAVCKLNAGSPLLNCKRLRSNHKLFRDINACKALTELLCCHVLNITNMLTPKQGQMPKWNKEATLRHFVRQIQQIQNTEVFFLYNQQNREVVLLLNKELDCTHLIIHCYNLKQGLWG